MKNVNKKLKTLLSGLVLAVIIPFPVFPNFGDIFSSQVEQRLEKVSTGEILVKLRNESANDVDKLPIADRIQTISKLSLGVKSLKLKNTADIEKTLEKLKKDPNIEFAEPNYIAHAFFQPNDPYLRYQWSFGQNSLNLAPVWDIATGNGVVVAVVDTGAAYENYGSFKVAPDLAGTQFVQGYNAINNSNHANDDNGHGTHVTGTIAQTTNNGIGTAGISYKAKIMPVKVLNKKGSGTYADIAEGIIWAADHNAKIINLSLGGKYPSETLRQALAYARGKAVFITAASGNDGSGTVSYPAAYNDYVVAVGATRYDKNLASYSNKGTALDLVAPGGDTKVDQDGNGYGDGILQQTFPQGRPTSFGYYFFQGTSMASPHVAAAAALLVEKGITDPTQIQQILQNSADDLGTAGRDNSYGYGLVNPLKALQSVAL